jgi:hypothetical protein
LAAAFYGWKAERSAAGRLRVRPGTPTNLQEPALHKLKQTCLWMLLTVAIGSAGNTAGAGYYGQYYSSWGYNDRLCNT